MIYHQLKLSDFRNRYGLKSEVRFINGKIIIKQTDAEHCDVYQLYE